MNFLLVIFLYPSIIIIEEKIVKKINVKIFSICRKKKKEKSEDIDNIDIEERPENQRQRKIHVDPKPSYLERFFGGPWNWFVNKAKWVIFVITIIWAMFAIWRTLLISPLTEQE